MATGCFTDSTHPYRGSRATRARPRYPGAAPYPGAAAYSGVPDGCDDVPSSLLWPRLVS